MGSAAGAYIRSRYGHDADLSVQLLLAAVLQIFYFGLGIHPDIQVLILPHSLIGLLLQLPHLLLGNLSVQVDGQQIASHMKAHIVIAEFSVDQAADNMFAGMVLHQVKPPLPADTSSDFRTRFQLPAHAVINLPIPLCRIQNRDLLLFCSRCHQYSPVAGLSAAFRIEAGSIQHRLIFLSAGSQESTLPWNSLQ